ncbi:unnamed protein product [Alternaria alternata]
MDMNQPIFSAPPGYVVDVDNPQRTGEAANFCVGTLGMIVAAIFMVIRVFTKTKLAKGFTPDDSKLAQISQNTSQAFCNEIQYLTRSNSSVARSLGTWQYISHGAGCSLDLADDQVYSASPLPSKFLFCLISVASIIYCPFLASAKLSLLFFYLRLSHIQWFRLCVYASMFLVVGYNIALVFPLIFALRLALLFPMLQTIDQTWAIVMPGIWMQVFPESSLIEANLVIITGCLPTMRLFFRHVAPRLIGESSLRSRSRKQSSTGYGGGSHHQLELKTIGSRATNRKFEYVEDDTVSMGSEERTAAGWRGDRDSEKGIVVAGNAGGITKTSSVIIESELRKGSLVDLRQSVTCLR